MQALRQGDNKAVKKMKRVTGERPKLISEMIVRLRRAYRLVCSAAYGTKYSTPNR